MSKNLFVITDPGLDPDDLLNAWLLTKLSGKGLVNVGGMMANYSPSVQRARLLKGVMNELDFDVTIASGTDCNSIHTPKNYEFDFPLAEASEITSKDFFQHFLQAAPKGSVTLQLISGLTDIADEIKSNPGHLKHALKEVYIMGGASWENGRMIADPTASNNKFDKTLDPQIVYDFFVDNQIPLRVLSRHAAYAASVTPSFYDWIKDVNLLGKHLHSIQESALFSLWEFANGNPPEHRLNRAWFSKTFCGMDDLPIDAAQSPWHFVQQLSLYDPLTSMWMAYPEEFSPSCMEINGVEHQIVGLSPEENGVVNPAKLISRLEQLLLE